MIKRFELILLFFVVPCFCHGEGTLNQRGLDEINSGLKFYFQNDLADAETIIWRLDQKNQGSSYNRFYACFTHYAQYQLWARALREYGFQGSIDAGIIPEEAKERYQNNADLLGDIPQIRSWCEEVAAMNVQDGKLVPDGFRRYEEVLADSDDYTCQLSLRSDGQIAVDVTKLKKPSFLGKILSCFH